MPRKKRQSTKRTEKVRLFRYHSVKCAQFSAPILAFLNWNHSRLVLHFPSLERLEVSERPSRFLFHGLCCIIQWSVCPFHAKSLSVPHISYSNHQELLKTIQTTKDMTVTLISRIEGNKWIKFATRTSTWQLTESAISSLLEQCKYSTIN